MSTLAFGLLVAAVVAIGATAIDRRLLPARGRSRRDGPARATWSPLRPTRWRGPWARPANPPTDADVATWCDRLARRVRTGDTLAAAIVAAEPPPSVRDGVGSIVLALDRGADLPTAVATARGRGRALDTALTVVGTCGRLGGPAAEPLDRAASALRRWVADAADRHTQSAQARTSAIALTSLPVAFLAVTLLTSSSVRAGVTSVPGAIAVGTGLALNTTGWWWMRRIIGGAR